MSDNLIIGGKELKSRLFVGSGKYSSDSIMPKIIEKSGAEVITVAIRRVDFDAKDSNVIDFIPKNCQLMPNTSGARTAEEAVRIALISKAIGCGNWIKIEVISDNKYLLPDNYETIKASEELVKKGFVVLPYVSPNLMDAKRLRDIGAAAVMPFAAPIGTNKGLQTKELIQILIDEIDLPIIVDAGIGKPSQACEAMEMGAAAVLVNTAIATAGDPVMMAEAFGKAVEAGRNAFIAKTGAVKKYAQASSPLTGFLR